MPFMFQIPEGGFKPRLVEKRLPAKGREGGSKDREKSAAMMRAMRSHLRILAILVLASSFQTKASAGVIHVWIKVLDHRGRPAVGRVLAITVIKDINGNFQEKLRAGFHKELRVTAKDGAIDIEAPEGWWVLDATRQTTKRGFPATERNYQPPSGHLVAGPPIYQMQSSNSTASPRALRLGEPEWDDQGPQMEGPLDMTTAAQGQTFRTDDLSAIPIR